MKYVEVGGQAVLGRQYSFATPWLTERHGYDPTYRFRQKRYSAQQTSV